MICVGIPTYNRSEIFNRSLLSFYNNNYIDLILVVADADKKVEANRYKQILDQFNKKIYYQVNIGRSGSVNSRNKILILGYELGCDELIMADDDYILIDNKTPLILSLHIKNGAGMCGGKVINLARRSIDPDFFLNTIIADNLSDITGYVFLDIKHGPRYAKYVPHFFSIDGDILNKVRYDKLYDTPTAFREESDLQRQIRSLGFNIVFDPRAWIIHLDIEEGGDRNNMDENKRLYWKSFGSTSFILKWEKNIKLLSKLVMASMIIISYRPMRFISIFKGIRDSLYNFKNKNNEVLPEK
ncbi:hypothetical protein Calag_0923 [Caldisphaera lagunensis DSM 15908]|uniref:Glycosyltransferase n=1 Tax=Caldisphaera lagunensis (strain DSM 15908 / JCM 11604 / ANMR 0165 / IC-154) TaxID=1056495 RepID=L0AB63_CALLD|nr:hypothetical protein [Caldisphaera lagunensis]AFZ70654.1 hypothetical protein Calag_0923 [Caldisphaera lagunensis DSM 15908]